MFSRLFQLCLCMRLILVQKLGGCITPNLDLSGLLVSA